MNHVPNVVKKLSDTKLKSLLKKLEGSTILSSFANDCVESSTKSLIERRPQGGEMDSYNWDDGYLKGLIDGHTMYKHLAEFLQMEIDNRKELTTE